MNYELFIARRIISGKQYKNSISSPIMKIAITAISLGVVIMMIAIATGKGLQEKIRSKISGFKGHIQITNYDANNSDGSLIPLDKNQEFYPKLSDIEGVTHVQVFANKVGLIRTKSDFEGVVFKGVSTDYDWTFFREYLIAGSLPDFFKKRTRDILLSKTIADRLKLKIGDTIDVLFFKDQINKLPSNRKLVITGIYNTGFLEFDKNTILGDLRQIQRLNRWNEEQIGGIEIVIDNFDDLQQKTDEIYKKIPPTLDVSNILTTYPAIFEWVELFDNNTWFIIAIVILVAGINMVTALLVLIIERIPMVGILKALGNSNWSLRKIFLYNASYLIFVGLFWGNLVGLTLLLLQEYGGFVSLDPATYYVSEVPISMDATTVILLNAGTLILCLLMLMISSYIITKIELSKSIRFA